MVYGADWVRQKLLLRLGLRQGEYFFDSSVGVPYSRVVGQKNPDLTAFETVLRRAITTCPGVASLDRFALTLDRKTRGLSLTFSVTAATGEAVTVQDFVP